MYVYLPIPRDIRGNNESRKVDARRKEVLEALGFVEQFTQALQEEDGTWRTYRGMMLSETEIADILQHSGPGR